MKPSRFNKKPLVLAMTMLMPMVVSNQVYASDASIYANPGQAQARSTAMFLLDNSGSMAFDSAYDGQTDVRINRLKKGMQRVLVGDSSGSPATLPETVGDVNLGLSHFTTSGTGRIAVPALLSDDRAALTTNGVMQAATIFPNSATFQYANQRDGVATTTNNGAKEFANRNTGGSRYFRVDVNDFSYLRFHIDIPKGATVTSARLILPAVSGYSSTYSYNDMKIRAEQVGHSQPLTLAPAARFTGGYTQAASKYSTDDLQFNVTSLVNSLVNRADWCGLNAVSFELTSSSTNTAYTFYIGGNGGSESSQPLLEVTWSMTSAVRNNTCMGKRTERQTNSPTWSAGTDYITNIDQMTQRHLLNLEIQRLIGSTGTPTTRAYAETTAYMMGRTTTGYTGNGYSASTNDAKTATGTAGTYQSPLPPNKPAVGSVSPECVSNGIFTLTDGEPNTASDNNNTSTTAVESLARQSIGNSGFTCNSAIPDNGAYDSSNNRSGWKCIGAISEAILKNSASNARQYKIKSIVVGFGSTSFWTGSSNDAKNAQTWGSVAMGGGFKDGSSGFVAASSQNSIVDAVQKFFDSFTSFSAISSNGSGVVPGSFGTGNTNIRYVYYPLFDPAVGVSRWNGNLKRYEVKLNQTTGIRTIVDAKGEDVLKLIEQNAPADQQSSVFNEETRDLWNPTTNDDGGDIFSGGLVSRLSSNGERRLFVDVTAAGTQITNGQLTQIDPTKLDDSTMQAAVTKMTDLMKPYNPTLVSGLGVQLDLASVVQQSYLKNYLWWLFNNNVDDLSDGAISATALDPNYDRTDLDKKYQLGGIFHSQPEVITTEIRTNNSVISQDDYLIFGTMQGLVHLVKADNGQEIFAFAPTDLFAKAQTLLPPANQQRLANGTFINSSLFYGMDAPWTTWVDYKKVNNTIKAGKIHAYGGMRMGGNYYYALDLTGLSPLQDDNFKPKVMFKIVNTGDYSGLGQTWSQPVVANLRINKKTKRVLVFGGGYDTDYETTTYVPGQSGELGAAIYIADAETGALIQKISADSTAGKNKQHSAMKYSIPSSVKVSDRDADGFIDHLYVGDLGGQVFRVDLDNYAANTSGLVKRVTTLADFNPTDVAKGVRFYQPPTFAPIINDTVNGGLTTGVLSIASGDASYPMQTDTKDYLFTLFDWDVMQPSLITGSPTLIYSSPVGLGNLTKVEHNKTVSTIAASIGQDASKKKGWYFVLPSRDSVSKATEGGAAKALVPPSIIDYVLNVTAFDPTRNTNSCGAGIKGATTTFRICLPYGACGSGTTTNIRFTELGAGVGKPLLVGSLDGSLSYANDTSKDGTGQGGLGGSFKKNALKDQYKFKLKVKPLHRWREVTSEKYQ